jgi:signal transduction histidine kinase
VKFRYRLDPYDTDWHDAGTRRQAFYTDSPPGRYTFRANAGNVDGAFHDNDAATLAFTIAPAYFQTMWFRLLGAMMLLALLWMAYRLRLRRLQRQFEMMLDARVAERTRIARDLHDTLLQSFNSLLVHFAVAALRFGAQPDEALKMLNETIDQARRAIREGREAVQGLRSSTEEPNDLAQAISRLAEELSRSTPSPAPSAGSAPQPIDIRVQAVGESRPLHPIIRDEMYRIAAEALRNALRHAHATQIEVELRYDVREFRLQIRDDGRGIDPPLLASEGRAGHFGLRGMRERADLAGGKLTVWSAPGTGTELQVAIPASRAYAAPRTRGRTESMES